MMPMKTFTLDEANASIPEIAKRLDAMLSARAELARRRSSIQPVVEHAGGNGGSKAASEYAQIMQRIDAGLEFFRELGCELKNLDQGLIDFPYYREGTLVFLCWKRGEDRIQFWHAVDAGFAGRQPL
jgi:hypothetical protein